VSKTVGTGSSALTTQYLVDTNNPTGYAQVLEELSGGGVSRTYTCGLMLASETQLASGTWTPSFYGFDGHGSVRFLTNLAGVVTDTYGYDAFGILIQGAGSTPNVYLYSGEQFDPDLGLYYQRARYLNTSLGRFWSMDPFEGNTDEPTSLHKYTYAANDPTDNVDPDGHDFDIVGALSALQDMAVLFAISHPILASVIATVLSAIVPLEVQFAVPEFSVASEVSASTLLANSTALTDMRTLFQDKGGFPALGNRFESWVGTVVGLTNSGLAVKDGQATVNNARVLGSAVIDFFSKAEDSILEVKLTAGALKASQTEQLAKYAGKEGIGLTYIFLLKPTEAQAQKLLDAVREAAPNVDVAINWLYTSLK
jgi:RHS repeat-associated protein